jgi:hypothetical protein
MMRKRAGFARTERAFSVCERALAHEANWPLDEEGSHWIAADVRCDARGRPVSLVEEDKTVSLEVLGALAGSTHDRGFRVRKDDGNEITLVREPGWFWYTDQRA